MTVPVQCESEVGEMCSWDRSNKTESVTVTIKRNVLKMWDSQSGGYEQLYFHVVGSDYRQGSGLDIGFIDIMYTRLGTTRNCNAIANFHTFKFNRGHAKPFPAQGIFTSIWWQRVLTMVILLLSGSSPLWIAALFQLHSLRRLTFNWLLPAWRSFHTNLLIFSSQSDFQLSTLATN
jgi:hypothetical protein